MGERKCRTAKQRENLVFTEDFLTKTGKKNEQKKEKIEKWTDFHKRWTLISDEQVSLCRAVRQSKA